MQWEPFHESHSIEVAAAAVNFSEPLTELAWRKAVRSGEAVCKAAGLTDKNTINSVEITIGPVGGVPQAPKPVEAIVFIRSGMIEIPSAGFQKTMRESLTIARNGITYQTFDYTRWETFSDRLRTLMTPALRSALHVTRSANLRLEYKDSFHFTGEDLPTASELLRSDSAMIAHHVFDRTKLWHSHTGFIEDADGCDSRLIQINIDATEAIRLGENKPFRQVGILIAIQNNLGALEAVGVDDADDLNNEDNLVITQLAMFDLMHKRSTEIFKQIVSVEAANRVGLK